MTMANDRDLEKLQRTDHDTLIRVEAKMDGLVQEVRTTNTNNVTVAADHEARIRLLEIDKDKATGAASGTDKLKNLLFAIAGLVVGLIGSLILALKK